jgi:hypothetical protein
MDNYFLYVIPYAWCLIQADKNDLGIVRNLAPTLRCLTNALIAAVKNRKSYKVSYS